MRSSAGRGLVRAGQPVCIFPLSIRCLLDGSVGRAGRCTFQGRQRPILIRYQMCGAAALLRATPPARPASGTTDYEVLCSGGVVGRAAAKPVDALYAEATRGGVGSVDGEKETIVCVLDNLRLRILGEGSVARESAPQHRRR